MVVVVVGERGGGTALCNGSCGLGMMPDRFHSWVPPQSALFTNCGLALFHECLMRVTETKFDFTCGGCILKTLRKPRRRLAHDWNMSGRLRTCDPHHVYVRMKWTKTRREQDGPVISAPPALPPRSLLRLEDAGCALWIQGLSSKLIGESIISWLKIASQ